MVDPPFETATVARIYMMQGMLDEAEAVYRRLLGRRPGDNRLEAGLAEVQRRREAEQVAAGEDRVTLEPRGGEICCGWAITDEGRARATKLLGRDGELVLRLVSFPVHASRPGQDVPLKRGEGKLTLARPRGAHMVAAAVGLKYKPDSFVSIAHCEAVKLT